MNAREQAHIQETLDSLQSRGDHFTRHLLLEKQRITHLESQLKSVNDGISELRESNKKKAIQLLNMHSTTTNGAYNRADGLDPIRLAQMNQQKLVNNLEGRLNKALVRQNSIQSENNLIKDKIDKLRRKVHNDTINRVIMEKQIKEIQEDVDDIMKRAAVASEERDKIIDQCNQYIRENEEEKEKYNHEYAQLSAYVMEQNRLLEMSIASVAADVVTKVKKTEFNHMNSEEKKENTDPMEEMKTLDDRIIELNNQYEANKIVLKQAEETNLKYQEAFKQLQDVSGLSSFEDISSEFVKNEEKSFSLFNYIQTVNQECDKALDELAKVKSDIEAHSQKQTNQENHRSAIVNSYSKKLSDVRGEKERLLDTNREGKTVIFQIAQIVQSLFQKLRCQELEQSKNAENASKGTKLDESGLLLPLSIDRKVTMFEGKDHVSEKNILLHMELIERRAIQIISKYAETLSQNRKGQRRPSVLMSPKTFDRMSSWATAASDVGPDGSRDPEVSDESDDSDEDESGNGSRPISVQDMRKLAAERMKRPKTPDTR